jgi:uronate dehydrogenase
LSNPPLSASFIGLEKGPEEDAMMHRVLITGAGGGIGRSLRETLRGVYPVLRLSDRVPLAPARSGNEGIEEVDQTDIADMAAVEKMVAGVDGIIHLGGISGENSWEKILEGNIVGLYNVFEAARRAGTKRIVMATSNHAVGFYPRSRTIDHRVVPRPDSRYGVSKAFSEALASLYADKHGIGFLCTRIGNFGTKPIDSRRLSIWISPRDYTQLVRIGLEHPDIHFEIVYGVSNNQRSWYDNSNAYRLGYRPQDDSEPYAAEILAAEAGQPKDPIAERYQGGTFCADEYDAETPPS